MLVMCDPAGVAFTPVGAMGRAYGPVRYTLQIGTSGATDVR